MISDKGGKGYSCFWFFSDKGGGGVGQGLHKAGVLCILDTRQIDPRKTDSIQKIDKSSWAEGPVCYKLNRRHKTQDIRH